ncbi:MAG: hypothetical protein M1813_001547 [Trichoglossum hirsutum]|nr:MAG: hypothetical protein M1813_001547 [Trichoglossum hirsutum]
MGQQIFSLVESFDKDPEKEKLANDALNSLVELAKLQIAAFGLAISAISTGDLGGVFRIDMHFFAYRYTSNQLKDVAKEVLTVSIVISSADLKNVSDNTLKVIVQQTYSQSSKEEQQDIYEQLKKGRDSENQPSTAPLRNFQPPKTVDVSQTFEAETTLDQARQQAGKLNAWIRASLADAFSEDSQQTSVECYQDSSSTSNSRITGQAKVTFRGDSTHDVKKVVDKSLKAAANAALSEFSISSYKLTVE